jgi:hypothetical protein
VSLAGWRPRRPSRPRTGPGDAVASRRASGPAGPGDGGDHGGRPRHVSQPPRFRFPPRRRVRRRGAGRTERRDGWPGSNGLRWRRDGGGRRRNRGWRRGGDARCRRGPRRGRPRWSGWPCRERRWWCQWCCGHGRGRWGDRREMRGREGVPSHDAVVALRPRRLADLCRLSDRRALHRSGSSQVQPRASPLRGLPDRVRLWYGADLRGRPLRDDLHRPGRRSLVRGFELMRQRAVWDVWRRREWLHAGLRNPPLPQPTAHLRRLSDGQGLQRNRLDAALRSRPVHLRGLHVELGLCTGRALL